MRRVMSVCGIAVGLALAPMAMLIGASASGPGWAITPTENPTATGGLLAAVSCPSATNCTAVGQFTDASGAQIALAEGWNGSSWSIESTPPIANTAGGLQAISCSASDACTAVGYAFDSSGVRITLAERWNGSSWTIQATPNPAGAQASSFAGVSCSSVADCTAVGSSTTSAGTQVTLAAAWNGTTWTVEPTPVPSGATASSLAAVACPSPGVCSAVGSFTPINSGAGRNLAEQRSGASWTLATIPTVTSAGPLGGVSCTDQYHCVAVGSRNRHPETETWNGIRWRMEPNLLPQGSLASVSCTALNACMAAGKIVARWDGSSWTAQPTPAVTFSDVSCSSGSACTLAGSEFLGARWQPVAERWNGSSWASENVPGADASVTTSVLSSVSCVSSTRCFAVGFTSDTNSDESIPLAEQWNGSVWSIQSIPSPGSGSDGLYGVSCVSARMCMAVGRTATGSFAERWNGTAWKLKRIATPDLKLSGVSCVSGTACTAVGSAVVNSAQVPAIATWNGSSWSIQPLPMPNGDVVAGLAGVSCEGVSACVAVGDAQLAGSIGSQTVATLAEQWNGTSWSVMTTPNPSGAYDSELKGVACTATACSAVGTWDGETSLAEQWNGTSWMIEPTPTPPAPSGTTFEYVVLDGVTCAADDSCIALGGYVYGNTTTGVRSLLIDRWDGSAWTIDPSPSPIGANGSALTSASCTTTGRCIAVGTANDTSNYAVTLAEQYTP